MPQDDTPAWVDRRTAEWCIEICDALHTRLWAIAWDRGIGAQACANEIRRRLPPALPAVIDEARRDV